MKLLELKSEFNGFIIFGFENSHEAKKWEYPRFSGIESENGYLVPKGVRDIEGGGVSDLLPDFTHFGLLPIPTFSERAIDGLGSMLSDHGEFAAIELREQMQYFGFNPTTIVDILSERESEVEYFDSGRVMAVDKYVLFSEVRAIPPIFKIPQTARNTTYVSESFVGKVQSLGLTGFKFELLCERD